MKKISLSQGKYAIVDESIFKYLNQWKWYCSAQGYACRSIHPTSYTSKTVRLHREVIKWFLGDFPEGKITDHINGNKLDNRIENLRICSAQQNICNQSKTKNNTSGYKGVSWHKPTNKWQARITYRGKLIHLGIYMSPPISWRICKTKRNKIINQWEHKS